MREIHRAAAEAVDEHDGAIGLLGVVGEDDAKAGATTPTSSTSVIRSPWRASGSGSTTPPASPDSSCSSRKGGKVLRGWPGGATTEQLRPRLEELVAR